MIPPVGFTASDNTGKVRNRVLLGPDAERGYLTPVVIPTHDRDEFEAWCRDHGMTILQTTDPLGFSLTHGEVRFHSADQRFEFKMRWNV